MVKVFEVKKNAVRSEHGEHIVGFDDTGSHACYLIYGVLRPLEKGRMLKPGRGHEEIILAVAGDIEVSGHVSMTLREGCAFHLAGEQECFLANEGSTDAVYVIAGGHASDDGHHH